MIPVAEALARVLALARPLPAETVALRAAAGRVLAEDVVAARDQPPFPAAAMDGYALRAADARPGAVLTVVGQAAAGAGWAGRVGAGEAVRIFTGAPVPDGADRVVIQEDTAAEGDRVRLAGALSEGANIRPAGSDFSAGARLTAPRRLRAADLALIAAMNCAAPRVARRPEVALVCTGDELVLPGETPGPQQIVASNAYGLIPMIEAEGGIARLLPVAPDRVEALAAVLDLARGADVIVTIGGASVGEHDLVARVAGSQGLDLAFHKVALRPGKPLLSGRLGDAVLLGLPGNPVSALVCAQLFLLPLLRALQGLPDPALRPLTAILGADLGPNGPRAHYMRARLEDGRITPFADQDSARLSILSAADALLIREPGEGPRRAGETVPYLPI